MKECPFSKEFKKDAFKRNDALMFEEKKRQSIYCNTPPDNACYNPLGKWQSVLAKLVIVNDYNDTVIL